MTDRIQPAVYKPAAVARLFQVSLETIYRKMATGEIPSIRIGRSVRVPRRWVDEQVEA